MLINAGIQGIIYEGEYPDELARELLAQANLPVERWGAVDNGENQG